MCVYVLHSSAPSALHAKLLIGKHVAELFQLAEEQRYAHEYGDSDVCETPTRDPMATSCLQELSGGDCTQERSTEAKPQQPAEQKTVNWQALHVPDITQKSPSGDHAAGHCGGNCRGPTRDTQPSDDRHRRYGVQASRIDLKTYE